MDTHNNVRRVSLLLYSDLPPPCQSPSDWLKLFLSQTLYHTNTPTILTQVILHTYLPMKMEQTECYKILAFKLQTTIRKRTTFWTGKSLISWIDLMFLPLQSNDNSCYINWSRSPQLHAISLVSWSLTKCQRHYGCNLTVVYKVCFVKLTNPMENTITISQEYIIKLSN
jgi:hypothetical protein